MQVLKGGEKKNKPLKRNKNLENTCVAQSFLHLYLLIKIKAVDC